MVRKRFAKLKREKNQAATVIQKHARGYQARRRYLQEHKPKLAAAVVIQSVYRGYKARRNVSKIKEKVEKMETERIYFLQQMENSSHSFFRAQKGHSKSPMKVPRNVVLPEKEVTQKENRQHVRSPGTIVHESARSNGKHIDVRPRKLTLAEVQCRNSPRSNRTHRKEIWSAGDETYFKSFMYDRPKRVSRDQERRIREMLYIIEGVSTDNGEVNTLLQKQSSTPRATTLVTKARNFFENQEKPLEPKPVVARKRSTGQKPEKPVTRPGNEQRKIKEPQKHADLVRQALAHQDVPVKSEAQENPRSLSPPARNMPSIPPPDHKLPPEKPGHLHHVTPESLRVTQKNFQAHGIHLTHNTRSSATQADVPMYSHLLRKTGRRGELGIEDNDDSDVTCISFNVPLIGVS